MSGYPHLLVFGGDEQQDARDEVAEDERADTEGHRVGFFALVDAEKISLPLETENIDEITDLGMELRDKINATVTVRHPYLDITSVDLVEFYTHKADGNADMKNCVIFGGAQADRSPCGTGTSAKLAALYAEGKLGLHEKFLYESITGSVFCGEAVAEVDIAGGKGIIPKITGSACITGLNEWIIDDQDPLKNGFLLGMPGQEEEENTRSRIVQAAWKLFGEKGYADTDVDDVIALAGVTKEEFSRFFSGKDDLEHTLGDLFDRTYAELMVSMSPRLSVYDKLIYLNKKLFTLIEKEVPFELVTHIYVNMPEERQEMLNNQRFYYKLIPQLFDEGQKNGEIRTDETPASMAETYASLERGMIYDWCVKGGKESLAAKGQKIIPVYLASVLSHA